MFLWGGDMWGIFGRREGVSLVCGMQGAIFDVDHGVLAISSRFNGASSSHTLIRVYPMARY